MGLKLTSNEERLKWVLKQAIYLARGIFISGLEKARLIDEINILIEEKEKEQCGK